MKNMTKNKEIGTVIGLILFIPIWIVCSMLLGVTLIAFGSLATQHPEYYPLETLSIIAGWIIFLCSYVWIVYIYLFEENGETK